MSRLSPIDYYSRQLGKVERVDLFIEDHGILTLFMTVDFGGSAQGFGGYALDAAPKERRPGQRREGTAAGCDFVLRLLQLFKADRLEKIVGRAVYALREPGPNAISGQIIGIELPEFDGGGSFTVSDWRSRWFADEGAASKGGAQ